MAPILFPRAILCFLLILSHLASCPPFPLCQNEPPHHPRHRRRLETHHWRGRAETAINVDGVGSGALCWAVDLASPRVTHPAGPRLARFGDYRE